MGGRRMRKETFICDKCGKEITDNIDINTIIASVFYINNKLYRAARYHTERHVCPTCGLLFRDHMRKFFEGK